MLKFWFLVKFLIIRFSSIGDIVLTTPVIRALKQQVEDSEVHFLVKPAFRQVIENNPYIDKIHILQDKIGETVGNLNAEYFDYIIDLQKNLRTARIKNRMGNVCFTFDKLNWAKWLMVNFKKNKLPDIHIVDRYFESVKLFDAYNDGKGLDYFMSAEIDDLAKEKIGNVTKPFVVLVVGAKHYTKQIPAEKAIEICRLCPWPVVLLGGKDDITNAKLIAEGAGDNVTNLSGILTLNSSAWVISKSTVVVTPDTGLMHIAAAFQKNIVSLWGNTIPEFGMYPYVDKSKRIELEIKDLKCRPCTKIGFTKCPNKHFRCMNDIPVQKVVEGIASLMEK